MIKGAANWTLSALAAGVVPFLAVSAVTSGVVFFGSESVSGEVVVPLVEFNHQRHVDEVGLDCSNCHPGCKEGISSGLPSVAACALCHSEPQGDTATEAKLVATIEAGVEVKWSRLFQQPAHVFFSHRRHTTVAEIECAVCHGEIGQSTTMPRRRAPLQMERCIACHQERKAPTDCSACHR